LAWTFLQQTPFNLQLKVLLLRSYSKPTTAAISYHVNESSDSDTESRDGAINSRFRSLVEAKLGVHKSAEEPKEHHAQAQQQDSRHPRPRVSETPITPRSTRSDQTIKQLRQEIARLRKENPQQKKTIDECNREMKKIPRNNYILGVLLVACIAILAARLNISG
jgi:hypothetical protein